MLQLCFAGDHEEDVFERRLAHLQVYHAQLPLVSLRCVRKGLKS